MKFNWLALVGLIASGGLGVVVQALQTAIPKEASIVANVAAIAVAIASVILQLMQPAAKVAADAPVLDTKGAIVGTNVSTTSTLPIAAQTKGPNA